VAEVISIQPLAGGSAAASYYLRRDAGCEHDPAGVRYYINSHDPAGLWLGQGSEALGLTGELRTEQEALLRELLEGRLGGEQLARPVWRYTADGSRVDVRRSGFDTTFSAPKSVSVLMALGSPDVQAQVRAAHAAAVTDALGLLEQLAARAARGHHGDGQRAPRIGTSGMIAAAFEHSTSRAGDPQLHTHVVIANLAQGLDGRWSALDSRTLHRQATTGSYLYQHRLRAELTTRLGVDWTSVDRGVAEVAGIPQQVRRVFSTRRAQIEAHLATHAPGRDEPTRGRARQLAARAACLITRPAKQHTPVESLRDRWQRQARAAGFTSDDLRRLLEQPRHVPEQVDRAALIEAVLSGEGVTRESATFEQGAVLRELCERLPAGADVSTPELLRLAAQVVQQPDVVPVLSPDGRAYTTVDMLSNEQRALALALRPDTSHPTLPGKQAAAVAVRSGLRPDQQHLVLALLSHGRAVEVITGPAGSGKTAALRTATQQWQAHGVVVTGTAVAALTAQGLEQTTGAPAVSLTRLLHQPLRHLPQDGVLLVDEAGMIGTRQLLQLLQLTEQRHCKLVLVGDPAQLPEMQAGGLFAALSRHPDALRLEGHGRQREAWERHALHTLRAGRTSEALDLYDRYGRLHTAGDRDALHSDAVATYLAARADASDPWQVTVLAARRQDVTQLNTLIRQQLLATGQLGQRALEVDTADGPVEYRTGDQVLVTRNDHQRGLLNGTTATVASLDTQGLTLATTDGRTVQVDRAWLEQGVLDHGYAMTIHKAQGRTVHTALLVGDAALSAEAGYVGLSRGTHANHLFLHSGDDARTEQPCQPAPAWRWPAAVDRRAKGLSALHRSSQQELASYRTQEGRSR
jgi:conjugative relaxase-like TrwC/TraI family protein